MSVNQVTETNLLFSIQRKRTGVICILVIIQSKHKIGTKASFNSLIKVLVMIEIQNTIYDERRKAVDLKKELMFYSDRITTLDKQQSKGEEWLLGYKKGS